MSDYAGDLPRGTNIVAGGGKKKKLHGAFTQRGNRKWHAVMRDGLVVVRGGGGGFTFFEQAGVDEEKEKAADRRSG